MYSDHCHLVSCIQAPCSFTHIRDTAVYSAPARPLCARGLIELDLKKMPRPLHRSCAQPVSSRGRQFVQIGAQTIIALARECRLDECV